MIYICCYIDIFWYILYLVVNAGNVQNNDNTNINPNINNDGVCIFEENTDILFILDNNIELELCKIQEEFIFDMIYEMYKNNNKLNDYLRVSILVYSDCKTDVFIRLNDNSKLLSDLNTINLCGYLSDNNQDFTCNPCDNVFTIGMDQFRRFRQNSNKKQIILYINNNECENDLCIQWENALKLNPNKPEIYTINMDNNIGIHNNINCISDYNYGDTMNNFKYFFDDINLMNTILNRFCQPKNQRTVENPNANKDRKIDTNTDIDPNEFFNSKPKFGDNEAFEQNNQEFTSKLLSNGNRFNFASYTRPEFGDFGYNNNDNDNNVDFFERRNRAFEDDTQFGDNKRMEVDRPNINNDNDRFSNSDVFGNNYTC